MNAWLLSIAGAIVVGVILELVLSSGSLGKFVRSIYAFFLLLIIVTPIPGFLRNGITIGEGIDFDWELIGTINSQSNTAAENRLVSELGRFGITGVLVTVVHDRNAQQFTIQEVFINAWNAQLTPERQGINIRTEVIRIATATLRIREDQITYYA